jgi:hypothetical protein
MPRLVEDRRRGRQGRLHRTDAAVRGRPRRRSGRSVSKSPSTDRTAATATPCIPPGIQCQTTAYLAPKSAYATGSASDRSRALP